MTELKNVKLLLKISLSLLKGEIRESSGISVKLANSSLRRSPSDNPSGLPWLCHLAKRRAYW